MPQIWNTWEVKVARHFNKKNLLIFTWKSFDDVYLKKEIIESIIFWNCHRKLLKHDESKENKLIKFRPHNTFIQVVTFPFSKTSFFGVKGWTWLEGQAWLNRSWLEPSHENETEFFWVMTLHVCPLSSFFTIEVTWLNLIFWATWKINRNISQVMNEWSRKTF